MYSLYDSLISMWGKDDDFFDITRNTEDMSMLENMENFDVIIDNDSLEEEKIQKTEFVDCMKEYSYNLIKGGANIYYSNQTVDKVNIKCNLCILNEILCSGCVFL